MRFFCRRSALPDFGGTALPNVIACWAEIERKTTCVL